MLIVTLVPSLLVTPLLAMHNVASVFVVKLMRFIWAMSIVALFVIIFVCNTYQVDGYIGLAIISLTVAAVSYWIINKITILILDNRDALYGSQLTALGIGWWEPGKWNDLRMYVRNSNEALRKARNIMKKNCSDSEKEKMIDALLPVNYYAKGVNAGWVGIMPAINVCENIYEISKIYKDLLPLSKGPGNEEWCSMISLRMYELIKMLKSQSLHGKIEDSLTRIVNVWVKATVQWIVRLSLKRCNDDAKTIAWVLLEGLYDVQKQWPYMAPAYKKSLKFIHEELLRTLWFYMTNEGNPIYIVYISALDKLIELDSKNPDLKEYRLHACCANTRDIYDLF